MAEVETFGQRLRRLLKIRKKNQRGLALYTGRDEGTVSRWIHGKAVPEPENLEKIAEYLGCTINYLQDVQPTPEPAKDRLARLMAQAQLSLADLARMTEIPEKQIERYAVKGYVPPPRPARLLAKALRVTSEYLVYGIQPTAKEAAAAEPEAVPEGTLDADLLQYCLTKAQEACQAQEFDATAEQVSQLASMMYAKITRYRGSDGDAEKEIVRFIRFAKAGRGVLKNDANRQPKPPDTDQERSENQGKMKPISG